MTGQNIFLYFGKNDKLILSNLCGVGVTHVPLALTQNDIESFLHIKCYGWYCWQFLVPCRLIFTVSTVLNFGSSGLSQNLKRLKICRNFVG